MYRTGTFECSVADPDPHGSGAFTWILNYFQIRIQQKMKEQIIKELNILCKACEFLTVCTIL